VGDWSLVETTVGDWSLVNSTQLSLGFHSCLHYRFHCCHCIMSCLLRFHTPQLKAACDSMCVMFANAITNVINSWDQDMAICPPRNAKLMPWDEVAVDLIGPWRIYIGGNELGFNALTNIDPVTNLVELIRIDSKTSHHVARQFQNSWLARYPRPNKCIHDNGGEFTGEEFCMLLAQHGIQNRPTTSKNPQANAVCERLDQTVANVLRTTLRARPTNDLQDAQRIVDDSFATAMHATRCGL
jgi:transposase InsO family protein